MFSGFGLLADEFPEPYYRTWQLEGGSALGFPDVRIPVEPFCGIMGVAWDEPGEHSTIPPRDWGGNQDIKQLTAGAKLYLPVALEGAIFSVGDPHAAQGDGEVCGTAIEMPAEVTLRFSLRRDIGLSQPAFEVPGALSAGTASQGYFVTTSHSPDLMEATRQSVRNMIAHLGRARGLEAADAYALVSVAGDLKVSEVVDAPDWIVSTFLPHAIFTGGAGAGP
jgi:acetamidase/formamidase